MAARGQLPFFCGRKNLKAEIIQILLSHFPRYGDVQVIFLLKLKMAAMNKRHIFLWVQKNLKIEINNNSHCTITLPTI